MAANSPRHGHDGGLLEREGAVVSSWQPLLFMKSVLCNHNAVFLGSIMTGFLNDEQVPLYCTDLP